MRKYRLLSHLTISWFEKLNFKSLTNAKNHNRKLRVFLKIVIWNIPQKLKVLRNLAKMWYFYHICTEIRFISQMVKNQTILSKFESFYHWLCGRDKAIFVFLKNLQNVKCMKSWGKNSENWRLSLKYVTFQTFLVQKIDGVSNF